MKMFLDVVLIWPTSSQNERNVSMSEKFAMKERARLSDAAVTISVQEC